MNTVTISRTFQVVIPKAVREELDLAAGQRLEAIVVEGRIQLIPVRPIRKMRGFLAGVDTGVERDDDRS